jgi:hypothetical protein
VIWAFRRDADEICALVGYGNPFKDAAQYPRRAQIANLQRWNLWFKSFQYQNPDYLGLLGGVNRRKDVMMCDKKEL